MSTKSSLPPLLFVHGAHHGAWCWEEHFLPYFSSRGFSCYAPNLRGHGGCEGFEKLHTFSLSDYMDDVLGVMVPLKEKPVLIGHSMGGAIVQKIAHACPDKVKAVILLASVPPQGMLKDGLRLFLIQVREGFPVLLLNRRKHSDFLVQLFFSNRLTVEEKYKYVKLLQPESRQAIWDLSRPIVPMPTHSLWAGLTGRRSQGISRFRLSPQVPMLVLGSKKDAIFPEKTIKNIKNIYMEPSIIFHDMCHDMMLDPEWMRVADAMYTFLSEMVPATEEGRTDREK